MANRSKYPGIAEAEAERMRVELSAKYDEAPDIIETAAGFAPNYDKFDGWSTEEVLVWLNID